VSWFVVDASVVLTWCFPDESAPLAGHVAHMFKDGDTAIVPSFWPHEILNALLVGEKRKRISHGLVRSFLDDLVTLPIVLEQFPAAIVFDRIQRLGREHDVAITRVMDIQDIAHDPHYLARGMFLEWDDPVAGRVKGAGVAPKFSETPGGVWRGAPWLGQDNARVLAEILRYPPDRITALAREGVIGTHPPAGPPRSEPAFFQREIGP